MIGIGVSPSLLALLRAPDAQSPDDVLWVYEGRPITRSVIHVLVRYRLAR
ncbi:hypothetical protein FDH38_gp019 [Dinoroseobacter phage vB_DshS-R5C]|uniref:Uncharacterized protein n=1 Tax=Dinoroseobacter phage vB_DshS-R5C TaxID=1965368 RepID=A0A1V0DY45_9CAUD|nr:hypothetical protein FDH38_gp019 [Dinoroseobacter phage vB_DshS-R5C]ARB06073.1 hypothetical protein vBDshSR5C_19 [Dinoroseobacter phage vB_DshS-R5C]